MWLISTQGSASLGRAGAVQSPKSKEMGSQGSRSNPEKTIRAPCVPASERNGHPRPPGKGCEAELSPKLKVSGRC